MIYRVILISTDKLKKSVEHVKLIIEKNKNKILYPSKKSYGHFSEVSVLRYKGLLSYAICDLYKNNIYIAKSYTEA